MGSSTSVTTENPEPRRQRPGFLLIRPRPAAADSDEASYFNERPHRDPLPSEVPPTGLLTEVLGEMGFYYGACCLYHRSAPPRRGKTR